MAGTYSPKVIDHAINPRNAGALGNADGFARIKGACGDTMDIWIKVEGDAIVRAGFMTDGCSPSVACGSMATELAKGKTIGEVLRISQQDILDNLDGLPDGSEHCAVLAASTIRAAIKDYLATRNEPWKKAYRNDGFQ